MLDYLRALEKAGFLRTTDSEYPCLMLTDDGEDFIDSPVNITLSLKNPDAQPQKEKRKKRTASRSASSLADDVFRPEKSSRHILERTDLREELRRKRLELAAEMNLKPYMIFNDAVLEELVLYMPLSIEETTRIKGIGLRKAEQFMADFVEIIQRYRRENML